MLYDLRLAITYSYDRPVGAGRHLLRVTPRSVAGVQRVVQAALRITPAPSEQTEFTDFFGTTVTQVVLPHGHDEVTFALDARVERLARDGALDMSPALRRIGAEVEAASGALGPDAPHHFLAPSPRIPAVADITAYARAATATARTLREGVEALGRAIHADFTFDAEATTVDTTPQDAFTQRGGVCQDFAQIMIAGLRGLGVPAAYVSGYLRTLPPPGKRRLEGADAMHAWVRAWCGREAGWVEYDPTNACFAGEDHIIVGYGRDYGDIPPVAGILRITGGQKSHQAVDVIPLPARTRRNG